MKPKRPTVTIIRHLKNGKTRTKVLSVDAFRRTRAIKGPWDAFAIGPSRRGRKNSGEPNTIVERLEDERELLEDLVGGPFRLRGRR